MAGTRAPFASLAALAAVASAQAEQTGSAAAEAAKKDLQSLPTVQRPVETTSGKSLFSGTSAITGLSVGAPSGSGAADKNRDEAASGKSANWLLDGVNQLEAESKAQRDAADGIKSGDKLGVPSPGERRSAAATTNPFAEYLTQWISPGDQALLNAGKGNASSSSTAPWETQRSDFSRETPAATQTEATASPFQMELPGIANFPANRTAQNPYLAEPFQLETGSSTAPAGSVDGRDVASPLPSILMPAQNAFPPVAPPSAPIEQARPAPAAAPTDRLIDDRKYFPQLRRF